MTLLCIDSQQSSTHKGNFLQGGKQPVTNLNQNVNHRRNSCSSPLSSKANSNGDSKTTNDPRKLERSNSEDGRRSSNTTTATTTTSGSNSSRYKTELCRPFEENGTCKYGDKCQFAHGYKELRTLARHPKYKTELCRTFHSTGLCPYGPRCHFIHNSEQTKKSLLTTLAGPPSPLPIMTRPKALSSLGSSGEMSPTSSHGGSPTGMKSFDDLFQNQMLSSNGYSSIPQDFANLVNQSFLDYPGGDPYDSVSAFGPGDMGTPENFGYQGATVLDLFQVAPPMTPTTPLDADASFFRLPIFDLFHKQ